MTTSRSEDTTHYWGNWTRQHLGLTTLPYCDTYCHINGVFLETVPRRRPFGSTNRHRILAIKLSAATARFASTISLCFWFKSFKLFVRFVRFLNKKQTHMYGGLSLRRCLIMFLSAHMFFWSKIFHWKTSLIGGQRWSTLWSHTWLMTHLMWELANYQRQRKLLSSRNSSGYKIRKTVMFCAGYVDDVML